MMSGDEPHELNADELRVSGLQQAIVERPTGRVVLTLEDVTTIQRSLHGYLVATDEPNSTWFEDRDYVLRSAQGAGWIDGAGAVCLSSWVLDGGQEPNGAQTTSAGTRDDTGGPFVCRRARICSSHF